MVDLKTPKSPFEINRPLAKILNNFRNKIDKYTFLHSSVILQEHAETEGTFAAIKADLYLSEELVIALLLCAQHSSHSCALTRSSPVKF